MKFVAVFAVLFMVGGCAIVSANQLDNLNLITGQKLPPNTMITPGDVKTLGLDSDAYKYLCTVSNKGCGNSITGLNPAFAKCLAKMIQAAAAQGQQIRIVSGARTVAEQTALFNNSDKSGKMVGSPTGSNHVKGKAADLGAGGGTHQSFGSSPAGKWTHANAGQYGLYFRMSWEPWHIEPKGTDCNNGEQGPGTQGQNQGQQQKGQDTGQQGTGGQPGQGGQQPTGVQGGKSGPDGNEQDPSQQQPPPQPPQKYSEKKEEVTADMSLSCTPESVQRGESVTVEWECPSGTRSVASAQRINRSFDTKGKVQGSLTFRPLQSNTYRVQCKKGTKVVAEKKCAVELQSKARQLSVDFLVSSLEVTSGEAVQVTWLAKNAKSCVVTGPGVSSTAKTGSTYSDPLESDAEFSISCKPKYEGSPYRQQEHVTVLSSNIGRKKTPKTNTRIQSKTEQTTFSDPLQEETQ